MGKTFKVIGNRQEGYYIHGLNFDKAKWISILDTYLEEVDSCDKCTISCLMELTKIRRKSTLTALKCKAIDLKEYLLF